MHRRVSHGTVYAMTNCECAYLYADFTADQRVQVPRETPNDFRLSHTKYIHITAGPPEPKVVAIQILKTSAFADRILRMAICTPLNNLRLPEQEHRTEYL